MRLIGTDPGSIGVTSTASVSWLVPAAGWWTGPRARDDRGSDSRGMPVSVVRSSLRDMTIRPRREEAVLAMAGLGWVTAWLWGQPVTTVVVVAVASASGLLVSRRCPRAAAWLVLSSCVLVAASGVPSDNPATLLPATVVVYGLGRWAGGFAAGCGLVVFVGAIGWADALAPPTMVFGAILYACFWGFGRLVAVKSARAVAARQRASKVGGQDPRVIADAVVAEERTRLANDIVQVVGDAVAEMVADASLAERDLDPVVIERIRLQGTTAVTELRRMLGLLRQSPGQPNQGPGPPTDRRWPWVPYVLTAVMVILAVPDQLIGGASAPLAVLVLLVATPLVLLLRNSQLMVGLLLATGAIGLVATVHPTHLGLVTVAVIVLLSWSTGTDGRGSSWLCWLLLLAVSTGATLLAEPDNAALQVVLTVLPAWAGHAWSESDREQRAAQQATTQAQSTLDRAVAEAVRQERLRVARDLHDVTSHALGVMVLQAGAANAQRETDPARARASLAIVADAGTRALADLGRLVGLIDAGVLGAVAEGEPVELADRLAALADRIRQTGTQVTLRVGGPPDDPRTAQVCYRVVQEALTNAVRHAPGSDVEVLVEGFDTHCEVSVINDGGRSTEVGAGGFGLIGAAERVLALDGEFRAGPEPAGGWAVRASIPARARVGNSAAGAGS